MIRPSRFTYGLIEDSGVFTVNMPTPEMARWVGLCGSKSGRDTDKFAAYDGGTSPAQTVPTLTIDGSPLVYECHVVHTNDLIPANLDPAMDAQFYGGTDYHRLYYGEILGTYADTGGLLRPRPSAGMETTAGPCSPRLTGAADRPGPCRPPGVRPRRYPCHHRTSRGDAG
jgi:flavin reductase (DIM6/NTAB) family NADH-FMN oxidoreductase RutF